MDEGAAEKPGAAEFRTRLRRSLEAFTEVFRHRDLRYLEVALGLNWSAENAYLVALSVYAYDHGGATAVGLVGLIRMVPAGVAGLFGAVVADRYRREWLLRLLYLGRALLAGATALAFFSGAPVWVVFMLAAVLNVLAVLLRPAYWALLPDLARTPEQLVACNVVASIFEGLAWLVGPAVAAVLIDVADPGVAFVAAGGALFVAAVYSARVKAAHLVQQPPAERRVLAETLAGVRTVARDRNARLIFGLFGAQTAIRGALNVLLVVSAIELLDLGEPGVGWLSSAYGVGGLAGAVAALALVGRRRLALPFGVGLILWGAPIALVGLWPSAIAALVLLGLPGAGNAVLDVAGLTMLQRIIPNRVLGRVFGALEAQVFATVGLGSLLASGLIAWLGVRGALIATGASLPALAALSWRRLRTIDETTVVPEAELALLRGVPMFAALPAVALEHLAANLQPVSISSRSRVFSEGENGDLFYVIAGGEVAVSKGRTTTARLGPGDYFGEIALLRGVPRTATVTARKDLELFSLGSEPFLAAVSGNCLCADAAEQVVTERMKRKQARRKPAAKKPAGARAKPKAKKPVAKARARR
jgi:MFS family permease